MSVDRLKVLQLLSDGSIDAQMASKILNGEAEMIVTEAPNAAEAAETVAKSEADVEIEVEIEEEPVVEKQPDVVIMARSARSEQASEKAKLKSKVFNIQIEEDPDAEPLPDQKVRITIEGKPVQAKMKVMLPGRVLQIGKELGSYFKPELNDVEWDNFDISFKGEKQQIRIRTEKAA